MTIYLDMDGVIADFFTAWADSCSVTHWKSIKEKEKALIDMGGTDFFATIPKFPESDSIVNFVRMISEGDWGICSSPLRGDRFNSAYWKRIWLQKNNYMPPDMEKLIFTSNKHKYAISQIDGKPNVLIDDKISNIKAWEKAGGIGIRFQCDEDDVPEYLFEEIKKVYK
jgi:hypothetical protein|tara:strand:- start:1652 stop:2155 length:504 start_codon:yes stop_codon:yes gene_type:complete